MNNIQIWPRQVDFKILKILSTLGLLLFAAFVGTLLPAPSNEIMILNMCITACLGITAWSAFNIIEPVNYDKRWNNREMVAVPIVWILLVLVFALCVSQHESRWQKQMQKGMEQLIRVNRA
jgi:hypothetical protein